jgi:hypothetical protein
MGLTKEARLVELYYKAHPEKLVVKSRMEKALEEVEEELNKLRDKGMVIKTIKKEFFY